VTNDRALRRIERENAVLATVVEEEEELMRGGHDDDESAASTTTRINDNDRLRRDALAQASYTTRGLTLNNDPSFFNNASFVSEARDTTLTSTENALAALGVPIVRSTLGSLHTRRDWPQLALPILFPFGIGAPWSSDVTRRVAVGAMAAFGALLRRPCFGSNPLFVHGAYAQHVDELRVSATFATANTSAFASGVAGIASVTDDELAAELRYRHASRVSIRTTGRALARPVNVEMSGAASVLAHGVATVSNKLPWSAGKRLQMRKALDSQGMQQSVVIVCLFW
jgi:hypothetical protein